MPSIKKKKKSIDIKRNKSNCILYNFNVALYKRLP